MFKFDNLKLEESCRRPFTLSLTPGHASFSVGNSFLPQTKILALLGHKSTQAAEWICKKCT